MSTITAILAADADGSVHLPIPAELRNRRVRVVATVEAADEQAGNLVATPSALAQRRKALAELQAQGGLSQVIPDPVAWQHEQREERTISGRE